MPSTVDLVCVPPADVHQIWPQARQLIKTAIERTDLSDFEITERQVLAGEQLLWLALSDHIEAAATTHLIKSIGKPVLVITALSGAQRERWIPLRHEIENYAKAEGCKCVRLYGRRGWERELKDYRVEHIVMEKAL